MDRILSQTRPGSEVLTGSRVGVSVPPGSLAAVSDVLAAGTLVVGVWLLIVAAALLLLRAVCLEPLDGEQDESDDEVSGHVPSE